MKVGDLVRFKNHNYRDAYGLGVVLHMPPLHPEQPCEVVFPSYSCRWGGKTSGRVYTRVGELEVINENR